jgi:alpha-ketoglutarate-dependent taurine dioxygenase
LKINKTEGGCGAVVTDADVRHLSDKDFGDIQSAFAENGVLFFRGQTLSPDDHLEFSRRWGDIDVNKFFPKVETHPEIAQLLKTEEQEVNIGGGWHTDHSYDAIPAMGSLLLARETPKTGGNTWFANCYSAYDGLSKGLKEMLDGLDAVHGAEHVFGKEGYNQQIEISDQFSNPDLASGEVLHPVVIRHPLSGRKSLYVNPGFTLRFDGWSAEESRPLLDYLFAQVIRAENIYKFHWEEGSLAFWDNRATWHFAMNDYNGQRRLMHRVTVKGCELER